MPRFDVFRGGTCLSSFDLVGSGTLVGRDPSADLVLDDSHVSRHHALVVREPEGLCARSLSQGTPMLVNGLPCDEKVLRHGDRLGFGGITLQFVDDGSDLPVAEEAPELPSVQNEVDTQVLGRSEATQIQFEAFQRMRPHLIIRVAEKDEDPPTEGGDLFSINCALVSVGSEDDCVVKRDDLPSRAFLIYRSQLSHRLRVLDEAAGITVTGWKVRDAALRDGDIIQVGPYSFEYHEGAATS